MTTQNIYSMTDVWDDVGTTFKGISLSVTDTASASGSLLMDLQVGGVSRFRVAKSGAIVFNNDTSYTIDLFKNLIWGFNRITGTTLRANVLEVGNASDLTLFRDAADTLAQSRSTNPQAFRAYNTYTDASNYERGKIAWESNVLKIGTEKAGTGSARALELQTDGTTRLVVASGGADTQILTSYLSIGTSANRTTLADTNGRWVFSSLGYLAFSSSATGVGVTGDVGIRRAAAGVLSVNNGGTTASGATLQLQEQTAPSAPAADAVRIYAEDDGSGKTRLMALFATGAAQQIAIEP